MDAGRYPGGRRKMQGLGGCPPSHRHDAGRQSSAGTTVGPATGYLDRRPVATLTVNLSCRYFLDQPQDRPQDAAA